MMGLVVKGLIFLLMALEMNLVVMPLSPALMICQLQLLQLM